MPGDRRMSSDVWAQVAYYTGLGFVLPAGLVAGYLAGWALDRWLHTKPVFAVIMAFLGAAAGIVEIIQLLNRAEKQTNGAHGDDSGPGAS